MNKVVLEIKVTGIEVFGAEAIDFINEKIVKDLKGTGNTVEVIKAETTEGNTVFEVETNFHNPITVTEYFRYRT